jgi:magnesium transporter
MQASLPLIQNLLSRRATVAEITRNETLPREDRHAPIDVLLYKQHLSTLRAMLDDMHPADIAGILGDLPLDQRLQVWKLVKPEHEGEILLAVPDAVRDTLIAGMDRQALGAAVRRLDIDKLAGLAPNLPQGVIRDVFKSLSIEDRERLRSAMSYSKGSVGALMDFNMIPVRDNVSLGVVSRYLRRFDELPDHTDQIFVVDRDDRLIGVLPLNRIVINGPEAMVGTLMLTDMIRLHPEEKADQTAQTFGRYDLVSAPVVDEDGKLVGRVTMNAVLDYMRTESENDLLTQAGLLKGEDIFASAWESAKSRWVWLALNLCAAFFASRVIGTFAASIEKFVALATLMPIVAGIAGNSASQTTAIIRSLALDRITRASATRVLIKELTISGLNGLAWGGAAGLFAYYLYHNITLGLVMVSAMSLNLMVGALAGLLIPVTMHKLGRDPGIGSNVLLTAITNSGGFFIFLGLATVFLSH